MPTIGSGLGGALKIGIESSYGTPATSFTWTPFVDFKATLQPNFQQGSALKFVNTAQSPNVIGSMVHSEYERVWSAADVTGTFSTYMSYMGLLRLWAGIAGGNMATMTPGTYHGIPQWNMPLASAFGSSLTLQAFVPTTAGVTDLWQITGVKITEFTVTGEVGSLPTCAWTVDGRDRTLAAASNPGVEAIVAGNQVYGFPGTNIYVGPVGSETLLDGIEKVTCTVKRSYQNARYTTASGNSSNAPGYALKEEPIENGFFDIGGQFDTEFISTASFVDIFMSQTNFSTLMQWNGGPIPGSSPVADYAVRLTMNACRYTGGDPTIDGPDIVKPSLPFVALNDEVHPPFSILVSTSETTL